jgi:hypothetical protein
MLFSKFHLQYFTFHLYYLFLQENAMLTLNDQGLVVLNAFMAIFLVKDIVQNY